MAVSKTNFPWPSTSSTRSNVIGCWLPIPLHNYGFIFFNQVPCTQVPSNCDKMRLSDCCSVLLVFHFVFGSTNAMTFARRWLQVDGMYNNEDGYVAGGTSVNDKNIGQYHGTTTLSFIYDNTVVIAADSKASMGTYVGSTSVQKIIPLTKHIVATMAGGAADCSYWIRQAVRLVKSIAYDNSYDFSNGYDSRTNGNVPPSRMLRVSMVARQLAESLVSFNDNTGNQGDLSIGTMIAGYDPVDGPTSKQFVDYFA